MEDLSRIDAEAVAAAEEAGLSGAAGNVAQTCPDVTLEVGIFFDGTLNNRFNTLSRSRNDDSYRSALSNPALLYDLYKSGNEHDEPNACGGVGRRFRSFYVEGPGSLRGKEDDQPGYAFGRDRRSGVEARVLQAFRGLLVEIGLQGGAPNIRKVVFDVFGFSRGAAGARYFVNAIRARRIAYDPWGPGDYTERLPSGLEIEIRFLGIFDTVAAIGTAADERNDSVNVHLSTAQVTGRIYHLTAQDEYRRNFRLNHNLEAGSKLRAAGPQSGTGGDAMGLPGAHSDVGGGYENVLRLPGDPPPGIDGHARTGDTAPLGDQRTEMSYDLSELRRRQAATRAADLSPGSNAALERDFVREGFMRAGETTGGVVRRTSPIRSRPVTVGAQGRTFSREIHEYDEQLALHRPWVRLGLSRVPLRLMLEAARARVDGALLPMPNSTNYAIPPDLPHVEAMRAGRVTSMQRAEILRGFGQVSMKDGGRASTDRIGHQPETGRRRVIYGNRAGQAV